jgi:hypothetical protein
LLGGSQGVLYWKLRRKVRAAQQSLGSEGLPTKAGGSLWDYIWCFSQKCHELPEICDAEIISVFLSGMIYQTLVHELSCDQSKTTKDLLDIATRHAFGE